MTSDVFFDLHRATAAARLADSGATEHNRHLRELVVARRRRRQVLEASRRIRLHLLPTG